MHKFFFHFWSIWFYVYSSTSLYIFLLYIPCVLVNLYHIFLYGLKNIANIYNTFINFLVHKFQMFIDILIFTYSIKDRYSFQYCVNDMCVCYVVQRYNFVKVLQLWCSRNTSALWERLPQVHKVLYLSICIAMFDICKIWMAIT